MIGFQSTFCWVACGHAISGVVFPNQCTNTPNNTLPPWSNYTAINSHFNYVKFFITILNVTGVTFKQSLVKTILVGFQPIYPGLKNLAILLHRLTAFWERYDVVVLIAEATITWVETFANNVTSCIYSPSFRISTWDLFCFVPAYFLSVWVKKSRSHLDAASATIIPVMLNLRKVDNITPLVQCVCVSEPFPFLHFLASRYIFVVVVWFTKIESSYS